MALPKRKISQSRRDKRRTHWKLTVPEIAECPQCHAMRMAHHVCPSCGFYRGRQVIEIKEKKEKKSE